MNHPTAGEVEFAVRAVLAELARVYAPAAAPTSGEPSTLTFPGRLLALREARSFDEQVRRVLVVPGTVVTPLAHDLLKQRGITVEWGSAASAAPSGTWGLVIEKHTAQTQAIQRTLFLASRPWQDLGQSPEAGARWAAESQDRGALIVSTSGALACWKACQVPGVRAASAFDVLTLQRALTDLSPNVLVLEPQNASTPQLVQLAEIYQRHGTPRVPADLEKPVQEKTDADRGSDWTRYAFKAPREPDTWPAADYPSAAPRGASVGFSATG